VRIKILASILSFIAVGCGPSGEGGALPNPGDLGESDAPVVYGTDNRTDVFAHADATLRARAQQSTVALMSPGMLNTTNPSNVTFNNAYTLGTLPNLVASAPSNVLCTTERFRNDPAAAYCSGTLIDDDLVLTAGHCVPDPAACANTRFVFGFYRTTATTMQPVTTADIFSCQAIVTREQRTVGGMNLDYAILRLDRAATPRFTPAPIRPGSDPMSENQAVGVIGSGSSIPFKIDSGGLVRDARASTLDYFVANTDTFAGNSGSGVYEINGYTVAGILVRGDTDYVANGNCNVVNVCTATGCSGESISYVRPAVAAYCQVATSARLCGNNTVAQQLYVGYFGRPADPGGLANMSAALAGAGAPMTLPELDAAYGSNATVRALVDSFGNSDESNALYTGDTASFVTAIYRNQLNRDPDLEGQTYWTNEINSGRLTKAKAALSIMAGAMTNTTAQGRVDGATVGKKTAVASNFSLAVNTSVEISAYQGNTAAATARGMLATVTDTTDVNAFQSTVNSTVLQIVANH